MRAASPDTQAKVDHYSVRLGEGGDPDARQCGWLEDRFGVSRQVVPAMLPELLMTSDAKRAERLMAGLVPMQKLDIDLLHRA